MTFIKLEIHGYAFESCKCLSMNFQNFGNAFPKIKYPFLIFANLFPKSMEIHFKSENLNAIFSPGRQR
jgi:hypothetical protein